MIEVVAENVSFTGERRKLSGESEDPSMYSEDFSAMPLDDDLPFCATRS